jgi:5-methyltetrahydrofolate--homocysteine methyltransferase
MKNDFLIFDGAMGTLLNSKGLMCEVNETLNITNPEAILDIHKSYKEAGAQIVKSNTFGANVLKLKKSGNDNNCAALNAAGINIARKSGVKVAADIGPSGELYYPYGAVTTEKIYESFKAQAEAVKGADMVLIETMSSLVEANLAYLAVRSIDKKIPVIVSFTFSKGYTMMGCSPEVIAKAFNIPMYSR